MWEEQIIRDNDKRNREENIIIKILRLLADEHFISLEEEIRGKEFLKKEAGK